MREKSIHLPVELIDSNTHFGHGYKKKKKKIELYLISSSLLFPLKFKTKNNFPVLAYEDKCKIEKT